MIDTAGRLHIDDALMEELQRIKAEMYPVETLFVADAMTGQDAVKSAKEFHDRVGVTGVILTKMDGDARGGAALSIKEVTGQPVKFVGVGEKYDALDPFYPDRIVSRILGMGDVLSLIEKVQEEVDEQKALELQEKMERNEFTLEDFRNQLQQMKKLGSMSKHYGDAARRYFQRHAEDDARDVRADGEGNEAHRGDHQFDDAGGTREPSDHQPVAPPPHRAWAAAIRSKTSTNCSNSTSK